MSVSPLSSPSSAAVPPPPPPRVFTGLKPTGALHLGNYLGAVRPLLTLAASPDHAVTASVVDLHALTVPHSPAVLRERTLTMAATLIACGLPETTRLFVQSMVPGYTQLHYLLESTATYGEAHRMIQFKEKSARPGEVGSTRMSLLSYPVLMAADVLGSAAQVVPVGEDQRQHLELARTVARRFNSTYGEVFTVPRGVSPDGEARIKDLAAPTTKMGKSGAEQQGVLFLLDAPEVVAAKVRRATTDADPVLTFEPERRPGVANLAVLLGALIGQSPEQALVGLAGAAALKAAVTEAVVEGLAPVRARFAEVMADPGGLQARLVADAGVVAGEVAEVVARASEAMGTFPPIRLDDAYALRA